MHTTLRAIADIAEQGDGIATTKQAKDSGASAVQLHRWVARGQLNRRGLRAVSFPGLPVTWRMTALAALAAGGDDALLSHRSAAYAHGLEGFRECEIEVMVPTNQRNRRIDAIVHSVGHVVLLDRSTVAGLACTSVARTIIDLAAVCSRAQLEKAVDSAVRNGGISIDFLERRLDELRHRGRPGVRKLESVLVDAGGTNVLERRFLRLCREAGLPKPACQVIHRRGSQTVARVDFDFAPSVLVVEVEGQVGHASPTQRDRDAKRRRDLQDMGRLVRPFTYRDVFSTPTMVTEQVRRLLADSPDVTNGAPPVSPV